MRLHADISVRLFMQKVQAWERERERERNSRWTNRDQAITWRSYGYRLSSDRERTKNRTTVRRDWEISAVGKWLAEKELKVELEKINEQKEREREREREKERRKEITQSLVNSSTITVKRRDVYALVINSVIRRKTDNFVRLPGRNVRLRDRNSRREREKRLD